MIYELKDVKKAYGQVQAVGGVDLRVEAGEFLVIAGASGSGKTTLLQLLGGLDRPSSGVVAFEGADLRGMSDNALALLRRRTIGFVFQQFNLIPTLTARQNVEVAMAPTGIRTDRRRARADDLLAGVGLADRAAHLPSQLSGGEQQRVAIARALANEPRVLLADEPTGNLDSRTGDEIMGLLERLVAERNLTVVLITHDQAIADRSPRLVRMRDGRLEPAGATA